MPHTAFFIMAFSDLNKFILRNETSADIYQKKVNDHTYEDDHHWRWFLEDLDKLGYNQTTTTVECLRALWSDETQANRMLMYRLSALVSEMSGIERLAMIEAIEETGNVVFGLTTPLANMIRHETGTDLRYCGEFHLALESGHAQRQEHAELAKIELTNDVRERCYSNVNKVFAWFEAWTHEALAHVQRT
ncbi:hypothetical protein CAter282_1725 [Collimonas arenae]|uniref:Uncharacterized protein n=2 Tax=Collimonas arenae TaxID=279058 RepID=A0A127PPB6_9BURK|nr:hypothetical protein CAter10_1858 [Collimonas arenae]AMP09506.1 hypothetical protein CAter282_1725 [Collimonas arenae]